MLTRIDYYNIATQLQEIKSYQATSQNSKALRAQHRTERNTIVGSASAAVRSEQACRTTTTTITISTPEERTARIS